MIYYHGGIAGIKDFILPPIETRKVSSSLYGAPARKDMVYLTTNFTAAKMFASLQPSNNVSVYEVEPIGELQHDIDCFEKGLSFECSKAKILNETPITKAERKMIWKGLLE
jgi:hypothetical protein